MTLNTTTPDTATGLTYHLDPLQDVTLTLGATATAQIGATAVVNAGTLLVSARNTVHASYEADAPPETIYDGVDFPSAVEIHIGVGNATNAAIAAGARVTVGGAAISGTDPDSLAVEAFDDTTVGVALHDASAPESVAALGTSLLNLAGFFDRLRATTSVNRDTQATVTGPAAGGLDTVSTTGAARVHAESGGTISSEVTSDFVGAASNSAPKDDAIARSTTLA